MDEKEKSDGVGRSRCCSWSWFLTVVVVDMWENLNVSEETGWERRRCPSFSPYRLPTFVSTLRGFV